MDKKNAAAQWTAVLVIALLPALVLFWLVPFVSDTTIGNDYGVFPISQQMELAWSQKHGSFPLYAPGFAMGRSQAALTMGQAFHPISHIAAALPGYWDGHALSLNTLLRLVSLAMAHLLIFFFLRRLKLSILPAFLISFLAVYNMRMLDLFRYGASLENYTGYLFLCASIGFLFIERRSRVAAPLAVIASTWLLVCGGHPQMMYLGLLGAALVAVAIPFVLPTIDPTLADGLTIRRRVAFLAVVALCVLAGIAMSAAYVASFYFEFVADNALRVDQDYAWSLAYCDTPGGVINSLFSPLQADVHGAFGSSQLLLATVAVPALWLIGVWVPLPILALILTCAAIFLCTAGEATPLHRLFWEYVPLAQTFRTPGRMSMMLPFLLLLIFAWLFSPQRIRALGKRELPFGALALPALVGAIALVVYHEYLADLLPPPSRYTPAVIIGEKMRDAALFAAYEKFVPYTWHLGLASLVLAFFYALHIKWKPGLWKGVFGFLLCASVVVQVTGQLRFGTWQVKVTPSKTLAQMDEEKKQDLSFRGSPGFGMESPAVTKQMEQSALEPALAKFYRNAVAVKPGDDPYVAIRRERTPANIIVEGGRDLTETEEKNKRSVDKVTLTHASFNRLAFSVDAAADGWLSINWPHDGRFAATVDGKESNVLRANGIENAVFLKKGKHLAEFRYVSRATEWGALFATLLAIAIGVFFSFIALGRRSRWVMSALCTLLFAVPFVAWRHSLYTGAHAGTVYEWTSEQLPAPGNLAYARPTAMSSIHSFQMPYYYYSGFATDGDRTGRSFATGPGRPRPFWQVDLGKRRAIGEIRIYDRFTGRGHLPLDVLVSNNGRRFESAARVTTRDPGAFWKIDLNGQESRWLRLQSGGRGAMGFAEVEVYRAKRTVLNDTADPTGNLRHDPSPSLPPQDTPPAPEPVQ